jgi:type IV pilus assembly protein PilM
VTRFGQVLLPRGAVVDGEVHEPDIVAQSIATLWKRAGFSSRRVRIGVANRRVVVRQVELPSMSREDLEGAIRFQAQDYIPIPLSEAVMDFEIIEEILSPEGQPLVRVLVVAAERGMVDPLLAAVRAAKLEPEVLELNAYPLIRALGSEEPVAAEAEAIVDVGGGVTNVVIHQGGKIRFTRMLPSLGGDDFTQAVTESLDLDWEEAESLKTRASPVLAARLGVEVDYQPYEAPPAPEEEDEPFLPEEPEPFVPEEPPQEAPETTAFGEDQPDAFGVPPETGIGEETTDLYGKPPTVTGPVDYGYDEPRAGGGDDQIERVADVLESVLQRFVTELRGSVDFYTTQSEALPLSRIVLVGGGSLLGGLRSQVGAALRVPAERGAVFSRIPVGKVKLSAEQISVAEPFLALAVGLALGGLEA